MAGADGCVRCIFGLEAGLKPLVPLLVLILYSFFGAFLFHLVEEPKELKDREDLITDREFLREQTARRLFSIHNELAGDEQHNYTLETLREFQKALNALEKTMDEETDWTFWGAMFFAATVYTSIGYGNFTPTTNTGMVLTVVYALIGIPLALYALVELGKLVATVCCGTWKFCCGKSRHVRRHKAKTELNDLLNFPLWLLAFLTIGWVFGSAGIFLIWETEWLYGQSLYFTIISFTTIGFGDYVPSKKLYMLLAGLFVLIGLALVSTLLAVVQAKIEALFAATEMSIDEQYQSMQIDGDDFGVEMPTDPAKVDRSIKRMVHHMPGGRFWYFMMPEKKKAQLKKRWLDRANKVTKLTQTDDYLMRSIQLARITDDTKSRDDVNSLVAMCDFTL